LVYYQKLYGAEKRPWYEAIANSWITKVVLFCGGVWVGQEMVKVR
jgi:hypothetical protein